MFESEMKGEGGSILMNPGWILYTVTDVLRGTSKAGNPQFIITIEEPNTGSVDTVYAIDVKGKRWILKQFLAACKLGEDKDGKITWCEEDVIGMTVEAKNVPEKNEYTNRDGEKISEMKNKIQGFRVTDKKATV